MKLESRIIRDHRVFGRVVRVIAASESEARRAIVRRCPGEHCWEAVPSANMPDGCTRWDCFVARHQDAFALND